MVGIRKTLSTILVIALAFSVPMALHAGDSKAKFRIDGTTLYYDSINLPDGTSSELETGDKAVLLDILRQNGQISTVDLNSDGGSIWAGDEMARIIIDFELDTRVTGECSSSCATVFLAGSARTMGRGGKIGFHGRNWSTKSIKEYYENNREDKGWETVFEFSSWVYADTQDEVYRELTYIISRGVDAVFAIETVKNRKSMWYPSRKEMQQSRVLRD